MRLSLLQQIFLLIPGPHKGFDNADGTRFLLILGVQAIIFFSMALKNAERPGGDIVARAMASMGITMRKHDDHR